MITAIELASALISCLEGSKLTSYKDSGGVWTIGIGHTKGVVEGLTITKQKESEYFAEDCAPLLKYVQNLHPALGAAYISFGFNCGEIALKRVLAGTDSIGNPKHTTDRHGTVQTGLVNRRNLELALIKLADGHPASTTPGASPART